MAIVGLLGLLAGVGLLAGTGALVSSCLRARGAVAFLITTALVAWALLVTIVLCLSPPRLLTTEWLLATEAFALLAAGAVWLRMGRPRPPALVDPLRALASELRDPPLAALAVVVGAGLLYVLGLAFFTPALEWDSLAYHLPRAAFWVQHESVSYVPNASDPRLDGNPPGAEIGIVGTMLWSGGDRYVALPQLAGLALLLVAIVGIGRRIGLTRGQSLFGALVFASLPVIAIQAPTTYNDLVVAAFLVVCAYGLLGRTQLDSILVALSFGLALMTKLTAVLALPVLALVALVALPRTRLLEAGKAGLAGLALGAPWYAVNVVETGRLDGGLAAATAQDQSFSLLSVVPALRHYVYSFVDFSGSRDVGVFSLYGAVAAAIVVVGTVAGLRSSRPRRTLAVSLGAAAIVVLPLVLVLVGRAALHAWFKLWVVVGRRDIAEASSSWQLQVGSDVALSWYGPAAAALLVAGTALVLWAVRRGLLARPAAFLAVAPVLAAVVLALVVPLDAFRGRFLAFAVALAAATWGIALARRPVAWGVVALAAVAMPLALLSMYTKPSSAPFVHGHEGRSVWNDSTDELFADVFREHVATVRVAQLLRGERRAIAIAARENDFLYFFFGDGRRNDVRLVPIDGGRVPDDVTWLVLAPGTAVVRCGRWTRVSAIESWLVERRDGTDGGCTRTGTPSV